MLKKIISFIFFFSFILSINVNVYASTVPTVKVAWVKDKEAYIVWDAVEGATQYNIYLNNELYAGSNQNSVNLKELQPNTEYTIFVEAVDNLGIIGISDPIMFTTMPLEPSPIRGISAKVENGSLILNWLPSPTEEAVTKYNVYVDNEKITEATTSNTVINNITPGRHYIEVKAVNDYKEGPAGNLSINIKTLNSFKLYMSNHTSDSITLFWENVKEADHYNIFVNDNYLDTTKSNQYTIENLQPDTVYIIKVIAEDEIGNKSEPATIEATTTAISENISFSSVFNSMQKYISIPTIAMTVLFAIGAAFAIARSAGLSFNRLRWWKM